METKRIAPRNEDGSIDYKAILLSELIEADYPQWEIDLIMDVVEEGKQ